MSLAPETSSLFDTAKDEDVNDPSSIIGTCVCMDVRVCVCRYHGWRQ